MSQDTNAVGSDSVIRITNADAHSSHVEDLLKRQASLRGEGGISRDTGRKWYYQNWFVLMIAGLLSALIGWTILRPFTQDTLYLQGKVQEISARQPNDPPQIIGHVKMGSIVYPLANFTQQRTLNGKVSELDPDVLQPGKLLGLYVDFPRRHHKEAVEAEVPQIVYVVPDPDPAAKASDDLRGVMRDKTVGFMLFFPVVAGIIGLGIGAADGIMCRLPRRIFTAGIIGLIVGLIGGFISSLFANIVYAPISDYALTMTGGGLGGLSTLGFMLQVMGRSLAWAVAGTTMGLGQGLALRSGRIILYGFLGGLIGGLLGGLLFDPIDLMFRHDGDVAAHLARLVSLLVIGVSVGGMIGVVELLARDAWLRMVAGPLAGKEFLIFKNIMQIGASPRSDIYLFNDSGVGQNHATIRATGDTYEIESTAEGYPVTVNGTTVRRSRLRHGDQIALGRTLFVFQRKTG